jgi:hypothetical protein
MTKATSSPSPGGNTDTLTPSHTTRPVAADLYLLMRFVRDFSRLSVSQSFRQYLLHRFGENTSVLRFKNGLLDGIYRIVKILPDGHNNSDFQKCSCTKMKLGSEQEIGGCWLSNNILPFPSQLWLDEDDASMNLSMFDMQEIMSMNLSDTTVYKMMVICSKYLFAKNRVEFRQYNGYPVLSIPGTPPAHFSVCVMPIEEDASSPASFPVSSSIPTLLGKNGLSTVVSELSGFILVVYTVLLLHNMPLVCTRDMLLVVRNAILHKIVDKQQMWRTTFVCSKCNLYVRDFTTPCEGSGVNLPKLCFACTKQEFQSNPKFMTNE